MRLKKMWFSLISMALFAMILTGCGNKNAGKSGQTQKKEETEEAESEKDIGPLVVYTDRADMVKTKFAEYKAIFEQDNPETEIVFKSYSDYDMDVSEELKQGDGGDVLLIPKGIEKEELSAYFDPLGTVEELSEIYDEKYLYVAECDGVVYGLPQYAMPQGIAYNKKVFEKAGIIELPQSPEEMIKCLKAIKASSPDVVPMFIGQERNASLAWWQMQAIGQAQALKAMSAADVQDAFNEQMTIEQQPFSKGKPAYDVCRLLYDVVKKDLTEEGNTSLGWKQVREKLNNGEIGCVPVEWKEIAAIREAAPNPDDIGYMPFPYHAEMQCAATTLEYCYAINKNSENKDMAKAWIDYMLKSSGYAKSENAISIRKKDSLPDFLANFENASLLVYQSWGDTDFDSYRQLIEAARQEDKTFNETMHDFNARWKKNLQGKKNSE